MQSTLDFPLNFLKPLLAGFSIPLGAFDPKTEWKSHYRTHCLVGNVRVPNGAIAVERSVSGAGFVLRIQCERTVGPGRAHLLSGEVRCETDTLATPRDWRATSDAPGSRGERLLSGWEGNGSKIRGPLTHQWSLLEAIQRLPRGSLPTLRFQYLTYDGRLLPDHTLTYRGPVEIEVGQGSYRLHGYEHLGTGILPWIYYTSDSGRLLIAVSGLEAWLISEAR